MQKTCGEFKEFKEQVECREASIFMTIPSLLVYQAVSKSKIPIWSKLCERFMKGITDKNLFIHTRNAIENDNFCSNKDFLTCLRHIVLELSDKSRPANIKPIDEQIAMSTSKSIKLLGCDLQRNEPVEWNDFMVACIGSE